MRVSESRSVESDSLRPYGLYSPWNSPRQNTGVGSISLFQGIFPTQGLNPGLLHCRQILYQLSHVNQTVKENVIIIVHHFQFNILEAAVRHENKIIYGWHPTAFLAKAKKTLVFMECLAFIENLKSDKWIRCMDGS